MRGRGPLWAPSGQSGLYPGLTDSLQRDTGWGHSLCCQRDARRHACPGQSGPAAHGCDDIHPGSGSLAPGSTSCSKGSRFALGSNPWDAGRAEKPLTGWQGPRYGGHAGLGLVLAHGVSLAHSWHFLWKQGSSGKATAE